MKKVEDDDVGEISEPEDPMMLQRDAKDWKVRSCYNIALILSSFISLANIVPTFSNLLTHPNLPEPRPLRRPRPL